MRLAIIGSGYVGLVSGACLAALGHRVACVDSDAAKIESLRAGRMPIYEPGLGPLVAENVAAGRLSFTGDMAEALRGAEAAFIAVGTPPEGEGGRADLRHVFAAAGKIARHAPEDCVLVTKSTVPVGTGRRLKETLHAPLSIASNPEFLREGSAIRDFLEPDRIVIGVEDARAESVLRAIYRPLLEKGAPLVVASLETAETIKYASNAFLAAKVAFINEIADFCEKTGADVTEVARGMGLDPRIGGQFLRAGPGYGGSCFPKDTLALLHGAEAAGAELGVVRAVVASNARRKERMAEKILAALGGDARGKRIAVLGLAFKPETDDVRESPALAILPVLVKAGARVTAYDPQAMERFRAAAGVEIAYAPDAYAALDGADGAVILTEWEEFRRLDLARTKTLLAAPLVIDLRNLFDPAVLRAAGFIYASVGRA